jgi:hypothetical protein
MDEINTVVAEQSELAESRCAWKNASRTAGPRPDGGIVSWLNFSTLAVLLHRRCSLELVPTGEA